MIGKLERVALREIWKHEAHGLTRWLTDNIDVVGDAIGRELSSAAPEQNAGDFSVDVLAEDKDGGVVVIENQLEKSDHDHLGKLITYLTNLDAHAAVWVVKEARPEHVRAITWLNQSTDASFYLLKIEAVRIGDSPAAPLLTLLVGPSEESRDLGGTKREWSERHQKRFSFWQGLLEHERGRTSLHAGVSPSSYNWIATGAGKGGFSYQFMVQQHGASVVFYVDLGAGKEAETRNAFDKLGQWKDQIEQSFGESLDWNVVEGRRGCYVARSFEGIGWKDEERWTELYPVLVDAMVRLHNAIDPYVKKL